MKADLVKVKDYRNTSFKDLDFTLGQKKVEFMEKFREYHPYAWNIYNYVNDRSFELNREFRQIYHEKCAYCGVSTQVISSSNFEVDHVIPKVVLDLDMGYDKKFINGIENLVSSCQLCNRSKQGFTCADEFIKILHPDNNQLIAIFNRTPDYTIVIQDEYKQNDVVKDFYIRLKLDNQLRRLDYLLMEMKDFCDKHEGETIVNEIQKLIIKIESNRRHNY